MDILSYAGVKEDTDDTNNSPTPAPDGVEVTISDDDSGTGIRGFEMVMGSSLNDTFTAPAEGGVTINGGGGVDTLTGGAGGDVFVLSVGEGPDTVTDYTPAQADEDDRGIGYRYLK